MCIYICLCIYVYSMYIYIYMSFAIVYSGEDTQRGGDAHALPACDDDRPAGNPRTESSHYPNSFQGKIQCHELQVFHTT